MAQDRTRSTMQIDGGEMIRYADSLVDESVISSRVVIVGAGPIGITLARKLEQLGVNSVIAESGFEFPHEKTQDLAKGKNVGLDMGLPREIRIRQFGGTMTSWGGNTRVLDTEDFRNGKWPISLKSLVPHYREAADLLRLPGTWLDHQVRFGERFEESAQPDVEEVEFHLSHYVRGVQSQCNGDFSETFAPMLLNSERIDILLGLNVLQPALVDERTGITSLTGMTLEGKSITLKGQVFVLACGGLENARMLLLWKRRLKCFARHKAIGKYLSEHPHGLVGFSFIERDRLKALGRYSPGVPYYNFDGKCFANSHFRLGANRAARNVFRRNGCMQLVRDDLSQLPLDAYHGFLARRIKHFRKVSKTHRLFYNVGLFEQAATEDSYVSLNPRAKDFFDQPTLAVNWSVHPADIKFARWLSGRAAEVLASRHGMTSINMSNTLLKPSTLGWGGHHMCTTRMGMNLGESVVDENCRVHGMTNLFVAGSSVFSSGGMANPTFTAMALALRLSGYLDREFFSKERTQVCPESESGNMQDLSKFDAASMPFPENLKSRATFEGSSEAACKAIYLGHGIVLTNVGNRFKMYVVADDVSLAPHLMTNGYWESWISVAFAKALQEKKPTNFVNVGGNHGYYALLASALDPNMDVVCFEPQLRLAQLIERSALVNGFGKLRVLSVAAGEKRGSAWLREYGDYLGSASLSKDATTGSVARGVEIVALDDLEDTPIDFMLIDAEGFEFEVLKGAQNRLQKSKSPCIFLEFSGPRYSEKAAFISWIAKNDMKIYKINYLGDLELMSIVDLAASTSVMDLVLMRLSA